MERKDTATNQMQSMALRALFITARALLAAVLLLLMTDLTPLVTLAYIPYVLVALLKGAEFGQVFLQDLAQSQWIIARQFKVRCQPSP